MITESDLRAVLTDEARDVSEPAEILARLHVAERQPTAKRRWLPPWPRPRRWRQPSSWRHARGRPPGGAQRSAGVDPPSALGGICGSRRTSTRSRVMT